MPESTPPNNRRGAPLGNKRAAGHGAPRGNRNAARHGFYSHSFTRREHERLDSDSLGKLEDEEIALRFLIDHIFTSSRSEEMGFDKFIIATRTVALAVGRIESIHRTRKAIYENLSAMEKAMDELKYIPVEQD